MRFSQGYCYIAFVLLGVFLLTQHGIAAGGGAVLPNYEIWKGDLSSSAYDLAISSSGEYIAAGSMDGTVSLIDRSGKLLWAYNNAQVTGLQQNADRDGDKWVSVAISSDGGYVAAGIWDNAESRVRSPKILFFDRDGGLLWTSPAQYVSDIAMTPDGSRIAVAADRGALLLDQTGSVVWENDRLGFSNTISVSDDGSVVAWTGAYNKLYLFDATGSLIGENTLGPGRGWGMDNLLGSMSADGSLFLAVQSGPDEGTVGLFGKDGSLLWTSTEPNSSRNSGDLSATGEYAVIGMENKITLIDRKGTPIWTQDNSAISAQNDRYYLVAISRDGSCIAAATEVGNRLSVWTKNGDRIWAASVGSGTNRLAMSSAGEYIVTASGSTLYLFKKDRNTNDPPYLANLKSNIRYDTPSFVQSYIFSKYLTAGNLVIGAMVIGIGCGAVYSIWRMKKYLRGKNPRKRV
ncbi:MAG: WD40 repeat domain-containing protein [Methanomicrobiales archaeon]|nr:WD40 repeat domain-containing protein [Methanomicrobiales archaeon]